MAGLKIRDFTKEKAEGWFELLQDADINLASDMCQATPGDVILRVAYEPDDDIKMSMRFEARMCIVEFEDDNEILTLECSVNDFSTMEVF